MNSNLLYFLFLALLVSCTDKIIDTGYISKNKIDVTFDGKVTNLISGYDYDYEEWNFSSNDNFLNIYQDGSYTSFLLAIKPNLNNENEDLVFPSLDFDLQTAGLPSTGPQDHSVFDLFSFLSVLTTDTRYTNTEETSVHFNSTEDTHMQIIESTLNFTKVELKSENSNPHLAGNFAMSFKDSDNITHNLSVDFDLESDNAINTIIDNSNNSGGGSGGTGGGANCDLANYNGPEFNIQIDSQCKAAYAYDCAGNQQGVDASCATYAGWQQQDPSIPDCPYCP